METLKYFVNPTQAKIEEISDLAESYPGTDTAIPAITIQKKGSDTHDPFDIFWLRDHYIEPHKTENLQDILMVRAVVLTESEFNALF